MNDKDRAIVGALGRIGISISFSETLTGGWGWSMQNAKIVRDWDGPYPSAGVAADAALTWLLEHARKGLLCHHLHPAVADEISVPIDGAGFEREAWYTRN